MEAFYSFSISTVRKIPDPVYVDCSYNQDSFDLQLSVTFMFPVIVL